ncbi:phosphoenolpyruvate carboxylase [Striga asiatica]|uniref:Phosphoenolpyruvate carboxylase n=1 Tax=Striga asiatica TaxID=4170 RepID=A0A5A7Q2M9_STRAF|nr:phosphoenolpyruvate carboxylase [Striga asiatica]
MEEQDGVLNITSAKWSEKKYRNGFNNNINGIILDIKRPIRHKLWPANEALHDQLWRGSDKEIQVKHSSDPLSKLVNNQPESIPLANAKRDELKMFTSEINFRVKEPLGNKIFRIVPTSGPRVDHDRSADRYIVAHDFGVVSGFRR